MKILTVCQRGNNRSAALGFILRDEHSRKDILNYGPYTVSKETEEMLCDWADKIIVTTSEVDVPEKYRSKRIFVDVGPDKWGSTFHPDLLNSLRLKLKDYDL